MSRIFIFNELQIIGTDDGCEVEAALISEVLVDGV
jgi:hypothetical protein